MKKRKKRKKKTAVATDRRGQAPDTTAAREHAHRRRAPDTTAVDELEQTNVNEDEQEAPVDRFRNAETMAPADELIPQGEHGATPRRKQQAVDHRATRTGLGTPNPETSWADAVNAQNPTRAAASVIVLVLRVESSQADGHQWQTPDSTVDSLRNVLLAVMATADELIPQGEHGATPHRKQQAVKHQATRTGLGTPNPKTSWADAVNAQNPTRAAASVIVPVLPVESSQADHDGHQQQPPIDSTIDRFSSRNVAVMAAADELRLIPAREHGVTPHQQQQAAVNHQPSSYQTDQAAASAIVPGPLVVTSQSSMINELTAYIFTAGLAFNMAKYQPIHPPPSMRVYM